jgi:hypothetical protein
MKTALVCIAKNEDNYIEEWIDYNIKLGFDHIFVYANDWHYTTKRTNVTVINIPGEIQQVRAYNNFKTNLSNNFKWAAFFDVDEFLVLNKHNNLKEFLFDYSDCNAIGINWAIFGNNGHETVSGKYNVLERFTKRNVQSFEPNSHIKSIVQLPCNHPQDVHNIHGTWFNLNKEPRNSAYNKPVDWSVAQLNHYFTKSTEEFMRKCQRGRADYAVNRKFEEYLDYLQSNQIEDLKALKFYLT